MYGGRYHDIPMATRGLHFTGRRNRPRLRWHQARRGESSRNGIQVRGKRPDSMSTAGFARHIALQLRDEDGSGLDVFWAGAAEVTVDLRAEIRRAYIQMPTQQRVSPLAGSARRLCRTPLRPRTC